MMRRLNHQPVGMSEVSASMGPRCIVEGTSLLVLPCRTSTMRVNDTLWPTRGYVETVGCSFPYVTHAGMPVLGPRVYRRSSPAWDVTI